MNLKEKIKNESTELHDYYRIALRDIEQHKANITLLNKTIKEEQENLYKAWELKEKCEMRAEEQGFYNLKNTEI